MFQAVAGGGGAIDRRTPYSYIRTRQGFLYLAFVLDAGVAPRGRDLNGPTPQSINRHRRAAPKRSPHGAAMCRVWYSTPTAVVNTPQTPPPSSVALMASANQ